MDPRKLFADDRNFGACVYCGGSPDTRDHVPSLVLLDEPLPENLPVVECCQTCNAGFSLDEEYFACFIECVIAGSTSPRNVKRPKVSRILSDSPALAGRIAASERRQPDERQAWQPEVDRVHNVLLKLARGHVAYELSLPRIDEPVFITCTPITTLPAHVDELFWEPQTTALWPEIGSRAFDRACKQAPTISEDQWRIVQPGRYQYLVSQAQGLFVRILISEYLACEVRWN